VDVLKDQIETKALVEQSFQRQIDDLEREKGALQDSLEERRRIDEALMDKLKQARQQFGAVAPSNEVESLKVQLERSETARAELADMLLKILQGP
jgi:hypothetical protein